MSSVIITPLEVATLMALTEEYPPYVTVLRQSDKFYAAVMTWDKLQERYEYSRALNGKRNLRLYITPAKIDAELLAKRLDLEVRL